MKDHKMYQKSEIISDDKKQMLPKVQVDEIL